MTAGTLKFVRHLVAGGNAEEIRCLHIRHIGNVDCECLCFHDVFGGLVVGVNEQCDLVHIADLCPCCIHGAD